MSSSDQQQPYPHQQQPPYPQPQYPYGQEPQQQQQQQQQQSYGDPAYGDASYGDASYGDASYDGRAYSGQGYADPSYGQQAPYAGGAAPYGTPGGYDAHPPQQAAPYPQQGSPAPQVPQAQPGTGWPAGEQGVAQTWEGQTWDTQYQPTIRPGEPAGPVQPAAPVQPAPVQPAEDTAYLAPLQGASGSYPLPPEARAAPATPAPAPVAPAQGEDGYSAPTTLGNSRITDAQRARAEGRSPIIAPGMQPAAITAGLGLLLALGAAVGPYALVVPLVLLQAVTAAGWFRLNGMWPARQGIALAFAGGLVADVALLAAGRENGPAAILGTLGVWVLLTVVLQLRSRAGADERMQGLMATVASAALAVLATGHLAAVPDAVTAGGVAVAAAVLVRALPLPGPASVVAALVVAAGAGAVGGAVTDLGAKGALLGLAAGGCALIGLRVASYDYPSRFVHMTAGVALPLTAAAPAVYLVGRMVA
ncbi:hypothetical protein JGS39_05855 [Streptomyces sp. P01-B04]|uniref:hypothetical protein n=1 Tax=Streptomyces poriferorum TaxID=2798799 RepID=UPI001C5F4099|nr:hypothetical protein [Streptomyces poriferorum]MBW5248551.1 hypothetical protein [Streptomyces poriferorum]MBW5260189.1 hypothetical protein [Streptomyces poriferorum]